MDISERLKKAIAAGNSTRTISEWCGVSHESIRQFAKERSVKKINTLNAISSGLEKNGF